MTYTKVYSLIFYTNFVKLYRTSKFILLKMYICLKYIPLPSKHRITIMKHIAAFSFFVLLLFFTLTACAPSSKEKYMIQYKEFINKVSENHHKYTIRDWKKIDEEYKKFNEKWYKKYKEDFTWKDEILIGKYTATYNLLKTSNDLKDIFEVFSIEQKDIDKLKEQIKYYIDNEMNDDLEKVLRQAQETSDTVFIIVNKLIEESRSELEK